MLTVYLCSPDEEENPGKCAHPLVPLFLTICVLWSSFTMSAVSFVLDLFFFSAQKSAEYPTTLGDSLEWVARLRQQLVLLRESNAIQLQEHSN